MATEVVPTGPVPVPLPMLVVMGPLSMYTPLTYQSSGGFRLTIRRTPTWKSAEFVDVLADKFWTTLVNGADPVDAQRPTVLELN